MIAKSKFLKNEDYSSLKILKEDIRKLLKIGN